MNPDGTPPADPENDPAAPLPPGSFVPTPDEGDAAVAYIERDLRRASTLLAQTRILCTLFLIVALVETVYVTSKMHQYLQPKQAADIADGLVVQRLNEQQPQLRDAIAQQLPNLVAGLPDQAINQMPTYRQNLESRFTGALNGYAQSTSKQLDSQLGDYLASHKEEVHAALVGGQDKAAVHQLGMDLTNQFVQSLKTTSDNGETLQSKLDSSLTDLQGVKKTMDRLAANKNLSPQDKKTRHMIAVLARTINTQTPHGSVPQAIASAQGEVASKL